MSLRSEPSANYEWPARYVAGWGEDGALDAIRQYAVPSGGHAVWQRLFMSEMPCVMAPQEL